MKVTPQTHLVGGVLPTSQEHYNMIPNEEFVIVSVGENTFVLPANEYDPKKYSEDRRIYNASLEELNSLGATRLEAALSIDEFLNSKLLSSLLADTINFRENPARKLMENFVSIVHPEIKRHTGIDEVISIHLGNTDYEYGQPLIRAWTIEGLREGSYSIRADYDLNGGRATFIGKRATSKLPEKTLDERAIEDAKSRQALRYERPYTPGVDLR